MSSTDTSTCYPSCVWTDTSECYLQLVTLTFSSTFTSPLMHAWHARSFNTTGMHALLTRWTHHSLSSTDTSTCYPHLVILCSPNQPSATSPRFFDNLHFEHFDKNVNHESRLTLLSKCSKWRLSKNRGLVADGCPKRRFWKDEQKDDFWIFD